MAVMVLFPMAFLKSFAYAGVATVAFAAAGRTLRHACSSGLTWRSAADVGHSPNFRPHHTWRYITGFFSLDGPFLYRWAKTVMRTRPARRVGGSSRCSSCSAPRSSG